jgi:hypothetical protein
MSAAPARHSRSAQPQTVAHAESLGTVQPLHTIAVRDLPLAVPGDLTQSRDLARRTYPRGNPVVPAQDAFAIDPLMGTFSVVPTNSSRDFDTPLLNFDAQNYSGVNPSDNVGDVGLNHYVQSINGATGTPVTIYNKADGSIAAGPFNMDTLAPSGICTTGL